MLTHLLTHITHINVVKHNKHFSDMSKNLAAHECLQLKERRKKFDRSYTDSRSNHEMLNTQKNELEEEEFILSIDC